MKKLFFFYCFISLLCAFSCSKYDVRETDSPQIKDEPKISRITLTFAGDIMAHDSNFKMADYHKIYTDLAEILLTDDLSFGNMEMPISDELPMMNYPCFNVHSSYLEAAIHGGFDVLAFANNHTNDHGTKGIEGTLKSIAAMKEKYPDTFYSGLKKDAHEKVRPVLIEKNGFRILFLSITELLNIYGDSAARIYYSSPTPEGRKRLYENITAMRKENPCDLFILTLHLNEAEYGRTVSDKKKAFFQELAASGVDIICASHPHVMQTWEKAEKPNADEAPVTEARYAPLHSAFFMYSMGNFISGQRTTLNYAAPAHYREYTGDAVLLQLEFTKRDGTVLDDFRITPIPVTVYRSAAGLVMRRFTNAFIENLSDPRDQAYYTERLSLMRAYLPLEVISKGNRNREGRQRCCKAEDGLK